MVDNFWYSLHLLLSYNKLFNYVVGSRGGGKTFSAKDWCIKDFSKTKGQFVWLRRYSTEMKENFLPDFFLDIKKEKYPELELECKGKKAYINGEVAGFFVPLSTSGRLKSSNFCNVNKIIFDEFVIDKGSIQYLKYEVQAFLELYETVCRLRENVRCLFLSNAITISNPYFLYFNLKLDVEKQFNVFDNIIVEFYKNDEFIKNKKKTRFGQIIDNTEYGRYAIENEFLRDNDNFIAERSKRSEFFCALKYNNRINGFWCDYNAGLIYMNQQYDKTSNAIYSMTVNDHEPNLLMIKTLKQSKRIDIIFNMFHAGYLRFNNQYTKTEFYNILKLYSYK